MAAGQGAAPGNPPEIDQDPVTYERTQEQEMALPKRRQSNTRTNKRRANWKMTAPNVVECPRCHAARLAHQVCPSCGFYQGRLVVPQKEKKEK